MTNKVMKYADVNKLVIHASATPAGRDVDVKDIDRWHREKGWWKVGYHFVIKLDGTVQTGRELHEPGAHARGVNDSSIGICMIGGVKADLVTAEDNYTEEQYAALASLLGNLKVFYPNAERVGHRDLPGVTKECPGFDVKEWMDAQFN
jgi:N-acetylmuramoyl-L-alanine amidase